MRLLVTRPEPEAATYIERLKELGHSGMSAPLTTITFAKGQLPLNGVQALVVTSKNALRALARSPSLPKALDLPIFTVGPGSGEMAAELGFERVIAGPASARELVAMIAARGEPSGRPLLLLSGDRQAFDTKGALEKRGFSVGEKIVYRTEAAGSLDPAVTEAIRSGRLDGVILMSPYSAEVFVALTDAAGVAEAARHLHYFCLSAAVANRLGPISPSNLHVAAAPNSEEMLALITRLAAKSH